MKGESISIEAGESVQLRAVTRLNDGYMFAGWVVDDGSAEITIEDPTASYTSFIMPEGNVLVHATYEIMVRTVNMDITVPDAGEALPYTVAVHSGQLGYEIDTRACDGFKNGVCWQRSDSDTCEDPSSDPIAACNVMYTLKIRLKVKDGYQFFADEDDGASHVVGSLHTNLGQSQYVDTSEVLDTGNKTVEIRFELTNFTKFNCNYVEFDGVPATCMATGVTVGRKCLYCGAVGWGCNTIPKTDHLFEDYHYNNDATATADGTKTAACSYGCGTTDTISAPGTMLSADVRTVELDIAVPKAGEALPYAVSVHSGASGYEIDTRTIDGFKNGVCWERSGSGSCEDPSGDPIAACNVMYTLRIRLKAKAGYRFAVSASDGESLVVGSLHNNNSQSQYVDTTEILDADRQTLEICFEVSGFTGFDCNYVLCERIPATCMTTGIKEGSKCLYCGTVSWGFENNTCAFS